MVPKISDIKSSINSCSQEEKKELSDWLLLQFRSPSNQNQQEELFLHAVCEVIHTRTKAPTPPYPVAKRVLGSLIPKAHHEVEELLSTSSLRGSKIQNLAMARQMTTLVIDYLQEIGVVVTLKTTLQQFSNLGGILDRAFPGYLGGGGALFLKKYILKTHPNPK